MNKNRKYEKSYREMAAEAGVSVGQIAKAVKVAELGRSKEIIDGKKTVNEILREAGVAKKNDAYARCVKSLQKFSNEELENLLEEIYLELKRRVDQENSED